MPTFELHDPRIIVRKGERQVDLFDGDKLVKQYKIALGFSPDGEKKTEGDGRTPEGDFYVSAKNPKSKFHLSLGLSYPGREDAERGLKSGLISQGERDEIVAAIAEKRMPLQKTKHCSRLDRRLRRSRQRRVYRTVRSHPARHESHDSALKFLCVDST